MIFQKSKKLIAICVSLCVFFSEITYASPGIMINPVPQAERLQSAFDIELPFELGTFDDVFRPSHMNQPAGYPFIFHIQTIHSNFETSNKVREIIAYLQQQYGVETVFAEGASGSLKPEFLEFSKQPDVNAKIVEFLGKRGELTGVDLALAANVQNSKSILNASGIENPDLYRKAFRVFRNVISRMAQSKKNIELKRLAIDKTASGTLSPVLKELVRNWIAFQSHQQDLLTSLIYLRKRAEIDLKIDFENPYSQFEWPQLTRLSVLQEAEKRFDRNLFEEECRKLTEWLNEQGVQSDFVQRLNPDENEAGLSRKQVEYFLESALPAGFRFKDYPQIIYRVIQRVLGEELEAVKLFAELNRLYDELFDVNAVSQEEKQIVEEYKNLILLQKLLFLELTPVEWSEFKEKENLDRSGLAVHEAERFYRLMEQRETAFLEKIQKTLHASHPAHPAVLITGGFHSRGMKKLFRENGMSYAVISPHITGDVDQASYRKMMMRGAAMEKPLLPQAQSDLRTMLGAEAPGYLTAEFRDVQKAILDAGFKPNPEAPFFQNRRTELRSLPVIHSLSEAVELMNERIESDFLKPVNFSDIRSIGRADANYRGVFVRLNNSGRPNAIDDAITTGYVRSHSVRGKDGRDVLWGAAMQAFSYAADEVIATSPMDPPLIGVVFEILESQGSEFGLQGHQLRESTVPIPLNKINRMWLFKAVLVEPGSYERIYYLQEVKMPTHSELRTEQSVPGEASGDPLTVLFRRYHGLFVPPVQRIFTENVLTDWVRAAQRNEQELDRIVAVFFELAGEKILFGQDELKQHLDQLKAEILQLTQNGALIAVQPEAENSEKPDGMFLEAAEAAGLKAGMRYGSAKVDGEFFVVRSPVKDAEHGWVFPLRIEKPGARADEIMLLPQYFQMFVHSVVPVENERVQRHVFVNQDQPLELIASIDHGYQIERSVETVMQDAVSAKAIEYKTEKTGLIGDTIFTIRILNEAESTSAGEVGILRGNLSDEGITELDISVDEAWRERGLMNEAFEYGIKGLLEPGMTIDEVVGEGHTILKLAEMMMDDPVFIEQLDTQRRRELASARMRNRGNKVMAAILLAGGIKDFGYKFTSEAIEQTVLGKLYKRAGLENLEIYTAVSPGGEVEIHMRAAAPVYEPPLISKPENEGLLHKHLEGEREADLTVDQDLWNELPEETREKIERVIAEYRDRWHAGDIEKEDGFATEKRAVKIEWEGVIGGEEMDGVIVSGVLFNRDDIGRDFKALQWGSSGQSVDEVDESLLKEQAINPEVFPDGRPDLQPAEYAQFGGHGGETALRKFRNARTILPEKGLRTPVALGYALYAPGHIQKNGKPLGVFISLRRKKEKRFSDYQHKAVQGILDGYDQALERVKAQALETMRITQFEPAKVIPGLVKKYDVNHLSEVYGRELRKVIDAGLYPHSPHFANFEADPFGRKQTIWHDLGGWQIREELTPEQAFGYAYMTLSYAILTLQIRFDNALPGYYEAKYIDPYTAFLKGFFYDQLDNPDFDLGQFAFSDYRNNSLSMISHDAVYRDDPMSLPPLYQRLDAPFIKVLRKVMGMPVTAQELADFRSVPSKTILSKRALAPGVTEDEWPESTGTGNHELYQEMRSQTGMDAAGPLFAREFIAPQVYELLTSGGSLDDVVEYGAGAGVLWEWSHDGFEKWFDQGAKDVSWLQTDANKDALRMISKYPKQVMPVDLRKTPLPFDEKIAALSWAGLDTLPVPELPAVVRDISATLKTGGKLIVGLDMGSSITTEVYEAQRNGWLAFPYFTAISPREDRPAGMIYVDWSELEKKYRPGSENLRAAWGSLKAYVEIYQKNPFAAEMLMEQAMMSLNAEKNLKLISKEILRIARETRTLRHIAPSRPALHIERIKLAAEAAGMTVDAYGEIARTYEVDHSDIPSLRSSVNHIIYSEGMVVQKSSPGVPRGKVRIDLKVHLLTATKTGESQGKINYKPLGIARLNGGVLNRDRPAVYKLPKGISTSAAPAIKSGDSEIIRAVLEDELAKPEVTKPQKKFKINQTLQQLTRELNAHTGVFDEALINRVFVRNRLGFTQSGYGASIAKRLNDALKRAELRSISAVDLKGWVGRVDKLIRENHLGPERELLIEEITGRLRPDEKSFYEEAWTHYVGGIRYRNKNEEYIHWVELFLALSTAVLSAVNPELEDLRRLDELIQQWNLRETPQQSNFSLTLLMQLVTNTAVSDEKLKGMLRLSGNAIKLPGEYRYRMAAFTLYLLGMHVQSSQLSTDGVNELSVDFNPHRSLRLAVDTLQTGSFNNDVPEAMHEELKLGLQVGVTHFLYGSNHAWLHPENIAEHDRSKILPLQEFIAANREILSRTVLEIRDKSKSSGFSYLKSSISWIYKYILALHEFSAQPPAVWDRVLLNGFAYPEHYALFMAGDFNYLKASEPENYEAILRELNEKARYTAEAGNAYVDLARAIQTFQPLNHPGIPALGFNEDSAINAIAAWKGQEVRIHFKDGSSRSGILKSTGSFWPNKGLFLEGAIFPYMFYLIDSIENLSTGEKIVMKPKSGSADIRGFDRKQELPVLEEKMKELGINLADYTDLIFPFVGFLDVFPRSGNAGSFIALTAKTFPNFKHIYLIDSGYSSEDVRRIQESLENEIKSTVQLHVLAQDFRDFKRVLKPEGKTVLIDKFPGDYARSFMARRQLSYLQWIAEYGDIILSMPPHQGQFPVNPNNTHRARLDGYESFPQVLILNNLDDFRRQWLKAPDMSQAAAFAEWLRAQQPENLEQVRGLAKKSLLFDSENTFFRNWLIKNWGLDELTADWIIEGNQTNVVITGIGRNEREFKIHFIFDQSVLKVSSANSRVINYEMSYEGRRSEMRPASAGFPEWPDRISERDPALDKQMPGFVDRFNQILQSALDLTPGQQRQMGTAFFELIDSWRVLFNEIMPPDEIHHFPKPQSFEKILSLAETAKGRAERWKSTDWLSFLQIFIDEINRGRLMGSGWLLQLSRSGKVGQQKIKVTALRVSTYTEAQHYDAPVVIAVADDPAFDIIPENWQAVTSTGVHILKTSSYILISGQYQQKILDSYRYFNDLRNQDMNQDGYDYLVNFLNAVGAISEEDYFRITRQLLLHEEWTHVDDLMRTAEEKAGRLRTDQQFEFAFGDERALPEFDMIRDITVNLKQDFGVTSDFQVNEIARETHAYLKQWHGLQTRREKVAAAARLLRLSGLLHGLDGNLRQKHQLPTPDGVHQLSARTVLAAIAIENSPSNLKPSYPWQEMEPLILRFLNDLAGRSELRAAASQTETVLQDNQLGLLQNEKEYPIAISHRSLYFQAQKVIKAGLNRGLPIVILNFDPHHDDYEDAWDTAAAWKGYMERGGSGKVLTVLPVDVANRSGGLTQNGQFRVPRGTWEKKDYRMVRESERREFTELKNIEITLDDGKTYSLEEYPGLIWLSLDYDFFSLEDDYHVEPEEAGRQLDLLADYLETNNIRIDEATAYQSWDYVGDLARADDNRWMRLLEPHFLAFRRRVLQKNPKSIFRLNGAGEEVRAEVRRVLDRYFESLKKESAAGEGLIKIEEDGRAIGSSSQYQIFMGNERITSQTLKAIKGLGGVALAVGVEPALELARHAGSDELILVDNDVLISQVVWPLRLALLAGHEDRIEYLEEILTEHFTDDEKVTLRDYSIKDILEFSVSASRQVDVQQNLESLTLKYFELLRSYVDQEVDDVLLQKTIRGFFAAIRKRYGDWRLRLVSDDSYLRFAVSDEALIYHQDGLNGTLANHENYSRLRQMALNGKIRGLSGDFAGQTLETLSETLKAAKEEVSLVYIDNILPYAAGLFPYRGTYQPTRYLKLMHLLQKIPARSDGKTMVVYSVADADGYHETYAVSFKKFMAWAGETLAAMAETPESNTGEYYADIHANFLLIAERLGEDIDTEKKVELIAGVFENWWSAGSKAIRTFVKDYLSEFKAQGLFPVSETVFWPPFIEKYRQKQIPFTGEFSQFQKKLLIQMMRLAGFLTKSDPPVSPAGGHSDRNLDGFEAPRDLDDPRSELRNVSLEAALQKVRSKYENRPLYQTHPNLLTLQLAWAEFVHADPEVKQVIVTSASGGSPLPTPFEWIELLIDQYGLVSSSRMLDVGHGLSSFVFAELSGGHVTSIEIDPVRVRIWNRFKEFLENEKGLIYPNLRFEQGDFNDYPVSGISFIYFFFTNPEKYKEFLGNEISEKLSREMTGDSVFVSPGFYLGQELLGEKLIDKIDRNSFFSESGLVYNEIELPQTEPGQMLPASEVVVLRASGYSDDPHSDRNPNGFEAPRDLDDPRSELRPAANASGRQKRSDFKDKSELRMISSYQLGQTFGKEYVGPTISGGINEDFLYDGHGKKIAVRLPWAKYVFRALDENGHEIPDRVFKITHYAADNQTLFDEASVLFRLQQDRVFPEVLRLMRAGMTKKGGMWVELQSISDARTLEREIFGKMTRLFEVLIRAAEIVREVHHKGYVHADLKPEQFLINAAQELQLIDFGNAREIHSASAKDNYTPGYVPVDENGAPIISDLAEDTDTYSFIVMIAQMLDIYMKTGSEEMRRLLHRMRDEYLSLVLKEWSFNSVQELWMPSGRKLLEARPRREWPENMESVLAKLQRDLELIRSEAEKTRGELRSNQTKAENQRAEMRQDEPDSFSRYFELHDQILGVDDESEEGDDVETSELSTHAIQLRVHKLFELLKSYSLIEKVFADLKFSSKDFWMGLIAWSAEPQVIEVILNRVAEDRAQDKGVMNTWMDLLDMKGFSMPEIHSKIEAMMTAALAEDVSAEERFLRKYLPSEVPANRMSFLYGHWKLAPADVERLDGIDLSLLIGRYNAWEAFFEDEKASFFALERRTLPELLRLPMTLKRYRRIKTAIDEGRGNKQIANEMKAAGIATQNIFIRPRKRLYGYQLWRNGKLELSDEKKKSMKKTFIQKKPENYKKISRAFRRWLVAGGPLPQEMMMQRMHAYEYETGGYRRKSGGITILSIRNGDYIHHVRILVDSDFWKTPERKARAIWIKAAGTMGDGRKVLSFHLRPSGRPVAVGYWNNQILELEDLAGPLISRINTARLNQRWLAWAEDSYEAQTIEHEFRVKGKDKSSYAVRVFPGMTHSAIHNGRFRSGETIHVSAETFGDERRLTAFIPAIAEKPARKEETAYRYFHNDETADRLLNPSRELEWRLEGSWVQGAPNPMPARLNKDGALNMGRFGPFSLYHSRNKTVYLVFEHVIKDEKVVQQVSIYGSDPKTKRGGEVNYLLWQGYFSPSLMNLVSYDPAFVPRRIVGKERYQLQAWLSWNLNYIKPPAAGPELTRNETAYLAAEILRNKVMTLKQIEEEFERKEYEVKKLKMAIQSMLKAKLESGQRVVEMSPGQYGLAVPMKVAKNNIVHRERVHYRFSHPDDLEGEQVEAVFDSGQLVYLKVLKTGHVIMMKTVRDLGGNLLWGGSTRTPAKYINFTFSNYLMPARTPKTSVSTAEKLFKIPGRKGEVISGVIIDGQLRRVDWFAPGTQLYNVYQITGEKDGPYTIALDETLTVQPVRFAESEDGELSKDILARVVAGMGWKGKTELRTKSNDQNLEYRFYSELSEEERQNSQILEAREIYWNNERIAEWGSPKVDALITYDRLSGDVAGIVSVLLRPQRKEIIYASAYVRPEYQGPRMIGPKMIDELIRRFAQKGFDLIRFGYLHKRIPTASIQQRFFRRLVGIPGAEARYDDEGLISHFYVRPQAYVDWLEAGQGSVRSAVMEEKSDAKAQLRNQSELLNNFSLEVLPQGDKSPEQVLYDRWMNGSPLEHYIAAIELEINEQYHLKGNFILRDDLTGDLQPFSGTKRPFDILTSATGVIEEFSSPGRGYADVIIWKIINDLKEQGFKSVYMYLNDGDDAAYQFFIGDSSREGFVTRWQTRWASNGGQSDLIQYRRDSEHNRYIIEIILLGNDLDIVRPFGFASKAPVDRSEHTELRASVVEVEQLVDEWISTLEEDAEEHRKQNAWSESRQKYSIGAIRDIVRLARKQTVNRILESIIGDRFVTTYDIGAGHGYLPGLIRRPLRRSIEYIPFDISQPFLDEIKMQRLANEVIQGSVYELPKNIRGAELLMGMDSYDTFVELEEAVQATYDSLRPGGYFIYFQSLIPDPAIFLTGSYYERFAQNGFIYSPRGSAFFRNMEDLRRALRPYAQAVLADSSFIIFHPQYIEFDRLVNELRVPITRDYFFPRMYEALGEVGFNVLQADTITDEFMTRRDEKRHKKLVGGGQYFTDDTNTAESLIDQRTRYEHRDDMAQGKFLEIAETQVFVARKPELRVFGALPDISGFDLVLAGGDATALMQTAMAFQTPAVPAIGLVGGVFTAGIGPQVPVFRPFLDRVVSEQMLGGKNATEMAAIETILNDPAFDGVGIDQPVKETATGNAVVFQVMLKAVRGAERESLQARMKGLQAGSVVIAYDDRLKPSELDLGRMLPPGVRYIRTTYESILDLEKVKSDRTAQVYHDERLNEHTVFLFSDFSDLRFGNTNVTEEVLQSIGFAIRLRPEELQRQPKSVRDQVVSAAAGEALLYAKLDKEIRDQWLIQNTGRGLLGFESGAYEIVFSSWLDARSAQTVLTAA